MRENTRTDLSGSRVSAVEETHVGWGVDGEGRSHWWEFQGHEKSVQMTFHLVQ